MLAAATIVLGAAVLLIALARRAPPFREVSDGAILEIYTLDALHGRLFVGPYSRFGWHHPGPLYFYLQAPWYWASGYHTVGMQAGALAINAVAFALIAWGLMASASLALTGGVLAALAFYTIRAGDLIVSVWNPHVIVLPLAAFVVLAARFAVTGERSVLIWLAILGSFLVQTHLAMAPIVAIVSAAALIAQRTAIGERWRPAALVALVLWLPPIVEQLTTRPGNLGWIAWFFVRGGDGQPLGTAVRAWSEASTSAFLPGFDVAMGLDFVPSHGVAPALAAALVVALVLIAVSPAGARRPQPGDEAFHRWLAVSVALAIVVALAATMRIQERIIDHEVFWMSALGAMGVGIVAGAAIEKLLPRPPAEAGHYVRVLAALAFVLVGANGMRHALQRARTIDDHAVDVLTARLTSYLDASDRRRPLVHIEPQMWAIAAGSLLQLTKLDRPLAVDGRWSTMFGERFASDGREDVEITIAGSPLAPVLITPP